MRTAPILLLGLSVLLVADGADAASKHERTRSSASPKSRSAHSGGHHHHDDDSGLAGACLSGLIDGCISGCFSAGCSIAGQAAADAAADEAARSPAKPPPPAPGIDAWPLEPEPGEDAEPRPLPEELVPSRMPAAPRGEEPEAGPPWMPLSESPEQPVADGEGAEEARPAVAPPEDSGDMAERSAAPAERTDDPAEGADLREDHLAAPAELLEDDWDSPEAFGLAAPSEGPPPPPEPGLNARLDVRATGAWIVADLPNASFDFRLLAGTRVSGPALEVWYTGLWERIDGSWDHLPVGGLRLAFSFGRTVRPTLRLGGTLLSLGPDDKLFGMDAGLALEVRLGDDEDAPWLEFHGDALLYEGVTGADFGGGVSFPRGPFYLRAGVRAVYLETFYSGPELSFGVRL
jgi:hypothetical protein